MDPERFIEIKHDNYESDLNLVVCTNPSYKDIVIEYGENGDEIFEQYVGKEYSDWQKIAKLHIVTYPKNILRGEPIFL
jgi:hypothetical protein